MSRTNRQGSYGGCNPGEPRLNGGFAEYIHLHPNSILHPIRGDIPQPDMLGRDKLLIGTDFPAMPRETPCGKTLLSLDLPARSWQTSPGTTASPS